MKNERMIQQVNEQRGIVLILSLLVMTILSVLGLAFLATARTEGAIASNYRNHVAAFYTAEAGLESGVSNLKTLLGTTPTPTDADLVKLVAPTLTDPNYTFDAFQVQRVRTTLPYSYLSSIDSGTFTGLSGQRTDYLITAQARGPRGSQARLTQTIQYMEIPLFQFAIFYGKGVDLEITPAPPMTLNGRVHANSNIYTYAGSTLHYDSTLTTSGHIYRYIKKDPTRRSNTPMIKDASGNYQPLNFDYEYDYDFQNPWSEADWRAAALSSFGGKVQDSAMGVTDLNLPLPGLLSDPDKSDVVSHQLIEKGKAGDSQALKDAKLYYQADLIIEGEKAYDQAGKKVDVKKCKGKKGAKAVSKTKFYDAREQKDIEVTEIDVGLLTACGLMPKNGILYATAKEGGPKKGEGIRLVNGAELPSQGLTVVSENPVYVQGDYNTVNKVPASVLGDAITVLSNNWGPNDYDKKKAKDKTSSRPAAKTTVNAAFAMGPNKESELGAGNGQLENLIRFLEDWKNVDFNYKGSLVALWHSQQAQSNWTCCGDWGDNYYNPPNRNWAYDTLFDTKPPPGTPKAAYIARGRWSEG